MPDPRDEMIFSSGDDVTGAKVIKYCGIRQDYLPFIRGSLTYIWSSCVLWVEVSKITEDL